MSETKKEFKLPANAEAQKNLKLKRKDISSKYFKGYIEINGKPYSISVSNLLFDGECSMYCTVTRWKERDGGGIL